MLESSNNRRNMKLSMATQPNKPRLSRAEAAKKIARLLEEHMTEMGLTEAEKDECAKQFARNVDKAIASARRKPSSSR
jgi:hypothetical protein